jgi:hypothetical protein
VFRRRDSPPVVGEGDETSTVAGGKEKMERGGEMMKRN